MNNTVKGELRRTMKRAAQLYGAFIAGILASAALAYWWYVEHMDGE